MKTLWNKSSEVKPKESTAMSVHRVLVQFRYNDKQPLEWRVGYWNSVLGWKLEGSPSSWDEECFPYWMDIPELDIKD